MRLPAINLNAQDLARLDDALQKEWLVTNGLGGYASSTVLGVNTRKYHGLLVAALHPPSNRTVCLSKLDEDVVVGSEVFRLGANEFQTGFFPNGYAFLREFSLAPFPKYVYAADEVTVEKTIFLPHGKNAVSTLYKVANASRADVKFRVFPMLTCRHFHTVVDDAVNPVKLQQTLAGSSLELTCENPKATITVTATEGAFVEKPSSVNRLLYREEARRGEASLDDCYQPGYFEVQVSPQEANEFALAAAADENIQETKTILESIATSTVHVKKLLELELERKANILQTFHDSRRRVPISDWLSWVILAADSFVARSAGDARSVIAGYHWFGAWGRDTFISLPGLLLVTGRFADAERVLVNFAKYAKEGLIPNFIPDKLDQEPAYNTVDATLWYVNAVLQYLKYTGDFRFVEENLWETLAAILDRHERGAAFGIKLDVDGLLLHGPRLTWMDAEVEGVAVTPRSGKAVEVQALWYNALRTVQMIAARLGHKTVEWQCSDIANRARQSFDRKFWNKEKRCLFDVVESSAVDASIRPNQVIAAALDFSILYPEKNELVVDTVQCELLTPFGLRTLARSDTSYCGVYEGDRASRDRAYHNGTVWPWLLGPFTTAFLKTKGSEADRRELASNFLMPLFSTQLFQAGLGTVSEIFDGEPPHTARGCISQAWSIAEPLRTYVEDVLQVRPEHEKKTLQP
jgi:predicted glycogen debranching enzyme